MTASRPHRHALKPGDVALGAAGAVLAVLYTLIAAGDFGWATLTQALLSWGFAAVLGVWRSRVRVAAAAALVLLAAWAGVWIAALPQNLGMAPWLLLAPMVVHSTTRRLPDRRWGLAVLAVTAVGSLISPVMWVVTLDGLHYRRDVDWLVMLAVHWLTLLCAHLLAARQLAREQRRTAERRAARDNERVLIAREVHDVLAHSLTLIKVQANAGLIGSRSDAAVAGQALGTIRDVSSTALDDLRTIVEVLRGDRPADDGLDAELAPAATVGNLPARIDAFSAAGLTIRTHLPADLAAADRELPAIVQLAVSRIIAEALTNALRHQGEGTDVVVELDLGTSAEITVTSTRPRRTGPGADTAAGTGTGTGLAGLAERAGALGGTLCVEDLGGVFRLHATIPLAGQGAA